MGPPLLPVVESRRVVPAAGRIRRSAGTVVVHAIYRQDRATPQHPVACVTVRSGAMPEMPEVEQLAIFLRSRAVGHVVATIAPTGVTALKTYDPPPSSMAGLTIDGVTRHGKFLDLDVSGLHLVLHLARAGWLRWKEKQATAPPRPGKGPLALRVVLDDGSGFDLTEAGTQKRLAVYVVRDPAQVPGIERLRVDPPHP